MAGNRIRCYLDVVIHHPDWTIEDFEKKKKKGLKKKVINLRIGQK